MLNGDFWKNIAYGELFLSSKSPFINFWWIQKSQILLKISMEKDGVLKNPISLMNIFWDTLYLANIYMSFG